MQVDAVRLSLSIASGEVLGLVGRSGAGKSTLARCIAAPEMADGGRITLGGTLLPARRTRAQRRRVQYVWQEPMLALSPYRSALRAVMEPLEGFALCTAEQRPGRAAEALRAVGIDAGMAARRPDGVSGGQCQRALLARASVAEPELLLLDEPFSTLDTVITAALLRELPALLGRRGAGSSGTSCAVLFVSHDRAVVQRLADRVCSLHDGRLVGGG